MAIDTPKGYDVEFYDFHGDLIPDELVTSYDTGTITCNTGLSGGLAGKATILRLDQTNDGNNEMSEVASGSLDKLVSNGHVYLEVRFLMEGTTGAFCIGLNDEVAQDEDTLPVEQNAGTWTSNAGTWIGFCYDSNMTNDNITVFWVDDDNDSAVAVATLTSDIALVADTIYTVRMDLYDAGSGNQVVAEFLVTDELGHRWSYRNESTVDRDFAFCWHIGNENRTTAGNYMDIDYVECGQSRCTS